MADPVGSGALDPVDRVRVRKPLEAPTCPTSVPLPAGKDGRLDVLWALLTVEAATDEGVTVMVWSTTMVLVETIRPQSADDESESDPVLPLELSSTPFPLPRPVSELPWLVPVGVAKGLVASRTGVPAPP